MAYAAANPDDEDFRSRYSAETAGMPANLATIAARNLATEDASIAKVNAAGRVAATPVSGSQYSTPESDYANAGIVSAGRNPVATPSVAAAAMDDISQRRGEIDSQRRDIQAKLGIIAPQAAGYSAMVLADENQRPQLLQNLHALETEDQRLLTEHHYNAIDNARTAHETFARESHIAAANDFSGLANDLLQVQKNPQLKPGTPEYGAAVAQVAKDHPAGFQTQAGQTLFRGIASVHDKSAALAPVDKSYWTNFGNAFKETAEFAKTLGVDPQYDGQGFPSMEATRAHAEDVGAYKKTAQIPVTAVKNYAQLVADNANQQAYLDKETDPKLQAKLKHDIATRDAQIAVYHKTYPQLAEDAAPAPSGAATAAAPAAAPTATPLPPNITPEAHAALKPGETFWWNGKQVTKK